MRPPLKYGVWGLRERKVILRKTIRIIYKYESSFSKNIQNEMPKAYLVDTLMEVR